MKQTILCVALMAVASLSAKAQLINIQFGGNDYGTLPTPPAQTGDGIPIGLGIPIGSSQDQWNDFTSDANLVSGVGLDYSTGASVTGATLTATGTGGGYGSYSVYQYSAYEHGNTGDDTLQSTPVYNLATSELGAGSTLTLSFTGLADKTSYSIYLLSVPDDWSRESKWSVNGGTYSDVGPLNAYTGPYQSNPYGGSAPTALVLGSNYLTLTGTTDGSGDLTIEGVSISGDVDINGLQLYAAPEPSTYALMLTGMLGVLAFRFKRFLKA